MHKKCKNVRDLGNSVQHCKVFSVIIQKSSYLFHLHFNISLSMLIYISIYLSIYLSNYLSIHLSIYLSISLSLYLYNKYSLWRSSHPEVPSLKCPSKNTTKSAGEHPRQSATTTKPPCSFNEFALQRGRSNINKSPKPCSKRAPPKDCARLYPKIQINLKK